MEQEHLQNEKNQAKTLIKRNRKDYRNGHEAQRWSFLFRGFGAELRHHYSGQPNGWGTVMVFVAATLLAILIYMVVR